LSIPEALAEFLLVVDAKPGFFEEVVVKPRFLSHKMVREGTILLQFCGGEYVFFRVGDGGGDSGAVVAERGSFLNALLIFFDAIGVDLVICIEGEALVLFDAGGGGQEVDRVVGRFPPDGRVIHSEVIILLLLFLGLG